MTDCKHELERSNARVGRYPGNESDIAAGFSFKMRFCFESHTRGESRPVLGTTPCRVASTGEAELLGEWHHSNFFASVFRGKLMTPRKTW